MKTPEQREEALVWSALVVLVCGMLGLVLYVFYAVKEVMP